MERIPKSMRFKIARTCLLLAGLFKFTAKMMLPGIIVEMLTVPGWAIIECHMIKQSRIKNGKNSIIKNGFECKCYEMPDEYCKDMEKLKKAKRMRHG